MPYAFCFSDVNKLRQAQGTIVGSAIIILIIISTYGLYISYTSNQRSYDQLQKNMRSKDFERQNENLEYYYDEEENPDKVELHVKNIGSLSAHILYIIELGDEIIKHPTDFFINPSNIKNVEELLDNQTIPINENNSIQLVSERGKVYQTIYEPEKDKPITRKVLNDYLKA